MDGPMKRTVRRAAERFVILGLNLTFQDSRGDAEAFVEEFNVPFPIVLDETGDVTNNLYLVRGIPTSVFVARDGTVTRVHIGALSGEQIDQFVGEILQ